MSDAFLYLKQKRFIEYSLPDHSILRHDLKLTPEGALRARNPIEAFREDGIKTAISALANSIARTLEKKFNA